MSRKLVVWIPELADTLNRKISAKAESLGFETVFPESREAAEQAAAEAGHISITGLNLAL